LINIDRINIFLHVAETQSFTKAAQQLHLSQSMVSKHIKELENHFQSELFIRSAQGAQLTDAGQTLLPWAYKLVRDNLDLQNIMGSLDQEISGHLKIACSTTTGKYMLPQLAVRFRKKHPNVRFSILPCTQELVGDQLLTEKVDLGVASVEVNKEGLECQYFFTDYIALIVPSIHPWAKRASIEPHELLNEPIILRESTSGTMRVLKAELAKSDISVEDLNVLIELGNSEAIVLLISSGLGISFVSKLASADHRKWGSVVNIPVNGFDLHKKVCIGRKVIGTPNRARDAFWGFIHSAENADILQLPEL